MIPITFTEVVQFAITRELEAAELYGALKERAVQPASRVFLAELEEMELEHAETLRGFTPDAVKEFAPEALDLKLSDYMEPPELTADSGYQDVVVTAMKNEEASHKLYKALAAEVPDGYAKEVFERLAREEARHKEMLEEMYEKEALREN